MYLSSIASLSQAASAYTLQSRDEILFPQAPVKRVEPTPSTEAPSQDKKQDPVTLSAEGLQKAEEEDAAAIAAGAPGKNRRDIASADAEKDAPSSSSAASSAATEEKKESNIASQELSDAELQQLQELKARDTEVRNHEQAHLASAGPYARGGASFTYQQGPDGRRYAIGGEVPIDVSEEKTAEETIAKMQVVQTSAQAPAEPSAQDRKVAAVASQKEMEATRKLQDERLAEAKEQAEEVESASASREATGNEESDATEASPSSRAQFANAAPEANPAPEVEQPDLSQYTPPPGSSIDVMA